MEEYREGLLKAIERTKKWGIACPGSKTLKFYVTSAASEFGEPSPASVAALSRALPFAPQSRSGACAPLHLMLLTMLFRENLPFLPALTIGNVLVEGSPRYQVRRQGLRQLLRDGPGATGTIDVHMWLTWPDLSILDLTILPALLLEDGIVPSLEDPGGLVLLGKPQDLKPRFTYVPHLVGEEFAWRVGAVQPMAEKMFKDGRHEWLMRMRESVDDG